MRSILPSQMLHLLVGRVFLLFLLANAEDSNPPTVKIQCYGKGELKCDEALKCEDNQYQDVRMGSSGCCQKCVNVIVEGERCLEKMEEALPDARCATGLECQKEICVKHVYEVVEIAYTPVVPLK